MTETPGTKGKVLLLDDDKFLVDMYSMKFTQAGFNVHACLSVSAAVEVLRSGFNPDVVLFDLVMPQEDGFAFAEKIRAEKLAPTSVLIALSNQSDEEAKKRIESLGISRYIVKASMIPSEVVQSVEEEMGKQKK